jgi:hypothetical protein
LSPANAGLSFYSGQICFLVIPFPERTDPQAHRPSRAPARAGRYPAVNYEIDGAPALFPLIAPLVLGEVSSGHHAPSPYLTGSPHVRFAPIASAVGTAAKRAERRLLRCEISIRLMTGVGHFRRIDTLSTLAACPLHLQ